MKIFVWFMVFAIVLVPCGALQYGATGALIGAAAALCAGLVVGGLMMAASNDDRRRGL